MTLRNINWVRDELILVCSLVVQNEWNGVRQTDPRAVELSDLLRRMPLHDPALRDETFRSPSSVQRKSYDIATNHPDYAGVPTRGGSLERGVLDDFLHRPDEMLAAAERIREGLFSGQLTEPLGPDLEDEAEFTAREGRLLMRWHASRERNKGLRDRKIKSVRAANPHLSCEVCGFSFEQTYGSRGEGFVECHHVVPLHVAGEGDTRLEDLKLVCSNCHRMIHRGSTLSPAELQLRLQTGR
jgi:5-methylcytosine-specific restriction enzyme A